MIKVAVGIIVKDGKALLCQRKKTMRYGLKWEFPGGKVENGEPLEECLRRELEEELGIAATIGPLYHRRQYEYPDSGIYDVFYYKVESYAGNIRNRVFEQCEWAPIESLVSYDILEGNRHVISMLMEEK
ncbi:MAG: NUDIX domain-containing protein [Bacteroidota bacterium]